MLGSSSGGGNVCQRRIRWAVKQKLTLQLTAYSLDVTQRIGSVCVGGVGLEGRGGGGVLRFNKSEG